MRVRASRNAENGRFAHPAPIQRHERGYGDDELTAWFDKRYQFIKELLVILDVLQAIHAHDGIKPFTVLNQLVSRGLPHPGIINPERLTIPAYGVNGCGACVDAARIHAR